MKKKYLAVLCLLFFSLFQAQNVLSQEGESEDLQWSVSGTGFGKSVLHGLIAAGEIQASNWLVTLINLSYGAPWALPTEETLRRNFTGDWKWEETDGYKVNQFGHPIQGAMYHGAARANGFNYYESLFFSVFGSFTWESFGEGQQMAYNDFIVAPIGALSMGEMLYRLYLEACAAGFPAPVAAFINPMVGFHRLVSGWEPPNYGSNLQLFQVSIGGGYAQTHSSISPDEKEVFSFQGPVGELGFSIIYGNPFEQNSRVPYDHFELYVTLGMDGGNYNNIRFISDGYLFSFSPFHSEKSMFSTGLSLHFDFISLGKFDMYDSTVDQSSYALDWTIKYQYLFTENVSFQTKFHAGFTFFGASEYYHPNHSKGKKDIKNYGYGFNSKLYVNLELGKLGRLDTNAFFYVLWSYPGTSALSYGTVYWLFADVTYNFFFTKHFSVGIADCFSFERGLFGNFPDTQKYNNLVKLFAAWSF